jgi:TonB-linked SusC/RagA family outer membrane protein
VTADVTPWLNAQFDANYYYSLNTTPFNTNAFAFATETPNVIPDSLPVGLGLSTTGPITTAKNTILSQYPTTNRNSDLRMTARAILKPMKDLSITGEYTYDNLVNNTNTYDKYSDNLVSTYTLTKAVTGTGMYTENMAKTDYQVMNVFATYAKTLSNHNIGAVVGFNREQTDNTKQTLSAKDMYNVDKPAIATATGTITGSDNVLQSSTQGFFGRLNYDYKSKYLLEFNGRYDGSSKFPENHRWGFFPSVSAGWRVTQESFMKPLQPWLSELKLRASHGTVGNQNIADYAYYSSMYAYSPYWLTNGAPGLSLSSPSLVSSSFTWETVQTNDLGLSWGMLNNKLTGSFDWYQRDTKGILTASATALPVVLGTPAPLQNSGALQSKGFELSINWKDKIGKVSYYVGANLYNYKSVVTKVSNPNNALFDNNGNALLYEGKTMGEIWGYVTDRLYTVDDFTAPAEGWVAKGYTGGTLKKGIPARNGQSPNPGDVLYKKFDTTRTYISSGANTLADHGDMQIIGNSTPQYQYGISGGVNYANFDFSFVIGGVLKQDLWLNNGLIFPNYWQSYSQLYSNQLNYWTPNNLDAYYGRIYYQVGNQGSNQNTVQTRYLQNGAYLRVKNLSLSYTLPASIIKKAHFDRLQVFYSIENPFEFDHLAKGIYPDVANQGGGSGSGLGYPFMRKSSVGINLTF